jgi:hypothetical protein
MNTSVILKEEQRLTTIEIETKMNALDVKEMGIGNGKKGVS